MYIYIRARCCVLAERTLPASLVLYCPAPLELSATMGAFSRGVCCVSFIFQLRLALYIYIHIYTLCSVCLREIHWLADKEGNISLFLMEIMRVMWVGICCGWYCGIISSDLLENFAIVYTHIYVYVYWKIHFCFITIVRYNR